MIFSPCQAQMKCLKARNGISHSHYVCKVQKWYLEVIALWKINFFLFYYILSICIWKNEDVNFLYRYQLEKWIEKYFSNQWQSVNIQEVCKSSWNCTKLIYLIFITKNVIKNQTSVSIILTNGIQIKSICFILKGWLKLLKRYFRIFFFQNIK